jgi:hypothetical protein
MAAGGKRMAVAMSNVFLKIRDDADAPRALIRPDVIEVERASGRCWAFRGRHLLQSWSSLAFFARAYSIELYDLVPLHPAGS